MRRVLGCSFFILLVVIFSGCLQPAPAEVTVLTTVPTPAVAETMPPAVTTQPAEPKQINVTATKTPMEVIVQYNGGPDAADLTALNIRINNQNGQNVQRLITGPVVGARYVFTYQGAADANVVNVVGIFRDGSQQTVLMAYV
jgi:hypothetical protein